VPYVFPIKKYFGKDQNIQYECFNQLVQEFEKDYFGGKLPFPLYPPCSCKKIEVPPICRIGAKILME